MRGDLVDHTSWLEELVADVHRRHPRFRRVTIERLVHRVATRYRDAAVQSFVPVLVRREALAQLRYAEAIVPAGEQSSAPDVPVAPPSPAAGARGARPGPPRPPTGQTATASSSF